METRVGSRLFLTAEAIVRAGSGGEVVPAQDGRHHCDVNCGQECAHIKLSSQGPRETRPLYHRYPTPPATASSRASQRATLPR